MTRLLPSLLLLLPLIASSDGSLLVKQEELDAEKRAQQELEERAADLDRQLRQAQDVIQRQDALLERLEAELQRLNDSRDDH